MSVIHAKLRVQLYLGLERQPTSLEVDGEYDPTTRDFTYIPLGRSGQPKVIHHATSLLIPDEAAQSSESTPIAPTA